MYPLVSVIVPVYNVEAYLNDCITAIKRQSYKNIEVILVNDGSTDKSGGICKEAIKTDNRFRLINQANGGLSSARNKGIEHAKGDYLFFVDSDDLIPHDTIRALLQACLEKNVKLSALGYRRFIDNVSDEDLRKTVNDSFEVIDNTSLLKIMLQEGFIQHSTWGKLYHKSCWEQILFPEGKYYEDYATTYTIVADIGKVAISPQIGYFYRYRTDSIMHKKIDSKRLDLIDIAYDVTRMIHKRFPTLENDAIRLMVKNYLWLEYQIMMSNTTEYTEQQKRIRKRILYYRKAFVKSEAVTFTDIVKLFTYLTNGKLFVLLYKLGSK